MDSLFNSLYVTKMLNVMYRPRGPMDKASDFESEDCGFDPHRGHIFCLITYLFVETDGKRQKTTL